MNTPRTEWIWNDRGELIEVLSFGELDEVPLPTLRAVLSLVGREVAIAKAKETK